MMGTTEVQSAAMELQHWFAEVLGVAEESLFGIAPDGPHRSAVVLDVLVREGQLLAGAVLDKEGKLYTPLCLFLAAGCRRLKVSLGAGHWRAAIENVAQLRQQASTATRSADLGLELGGPVELFFQELKQAITQAGLAGAPKLLNPENRDIALGLAINWGLRFLLAYASECSLDASRSSGRRDLAWIASLLLPPPERSQAPAMGR